MIAPPGKSHEQCCMLLDWYKQLALYKAYTESFRSGFRPIYKRTELTLIRLDAAHTRNVKLQQAAQERYLVSKGLIGTVEALSYYLTVTYAVKTTLAKLVETAITVSSELLEYLLQKLINALEVTQSEILNSVSAAAGSTAITGNTLAVKESSDALIALLKNTKYAVKQADGVTRSLLANLISESIIGLVDGFLEGSHNQAEQIIEQSEQILNINKNSLQRQHMMYEHVDELTRTTLIRIRKMLDNAKATSRSCREAIQSNYEEYSARCSPRYETILSNINNQYSEAMAALEEEKRREEKKLETAEIGIGKDLRKYDARLNSVQSFFEQMVDYCITYPDRKEMCESLRKKYIKMRDGYDPQPDLIGQRLALETLDDIRTSYLEFIEQYPQEIERIALVRDNQTLSITREYTNCMADSFPQCDTSSADFKQAQQRVDGLEIELPKIYENYLSFIRNFSLTPLPPCGEEEEVGEVGAIEEIPVEDLIPLYMDPDYEAHLALLELSERQYEITRKVENAEYDSYAEKEAAVFALLDAHAAESQQLLDSYKPKKQRHKEILEALYKRQEEQNAAELDRREKERAKIREDAAEKAKEMAERIKNGEVPPEELSMMFSTDSDGLQVNEEIARLGEEWGAADEELRLKHTRTIAEYRARARQLAQLNVDYERNIRNLRYELENKQIIKGELMRSLTGTAPPPTFPGIQRLPFGASPGAPGTPGTPGTPPPIIMPPP